MAGRLREQTGEAKSESEPPNEPTEISAGCFDLRRDGFSSRPALLRSTDIVHNHAGPIFFAKAWAMERPIPQDRAAPTKNAPQFTTPLIPPLRASPNNRVSEVERGPSRPNHSASRRPRPVPPSRGFSACRENHRPIPGVLPRDWSALSGRR